MRLFAANLITGPPVCRDEEELRRWFEDPLFASGNQKNLFMMKMTICRILKAETMLPRIMIVRMLKILRIWIDVYARECGGLAAGGLRRQLSATSPKEKAPEAPSALSPCLEFLYNFSDSNLYGK